MISYRYKKYFTVLLSIFILFASVAVDAKSRWSSSCRSAIFSNSTKVKRYYGKSVHKKVYPASTTKIMTALLVLEKLPLDKYITVGKRATYAQPSKLYLKPGEKYKVRDLLYAILLNSANDASIVLAEAVAGTEWKFVQMMNARAKEIGTKHTKFANSNGLPSTKVKQYTTAYDMYLIFRKALKNKFFVNAIKLKYKTISSSSGRKLSLKSHNKILFKNWKRNIYGKTGWTKAAGACFVGTLDHKGDTLIVAVFGCKDRWGDIQHMFSYYAGVPL